MASFIGRTRTLILTLSNRLTEGGEATATEYDDGSASETDGTSSTGSGSYYESDDSSLMPLGNRSVVVIFYVSRVIGAEAVAIRCQGQQLTASFHSLVTLRVFFCF